MHRRGETIRTVEARGGGPYVGGARRPDLIGKESQRTVRGCAREAAGKMGVAAAFGTFGSDEPDILGTRAGDRSQAVQIEDVRLAPRGPVPMQGCTEGIAERRGNCAPTHTSLATHCVLLRHAPNVLHSGAAPQHA